MPVQLLKFSEWFRVRKEKTPMKKFLSITLVLALLFNLNAYAGWSGATTDTFGTDATCKLSGLLGIATLESINGTNENSMTFDLETYSKRVDIYGNDAELRFGKSANDAFDSVQYYDGVSAYTNNTTESSLSFGTAYTILADTNDLFYCGKSSKFTMINIDISTAASSATLVCEYSKGSGVWGTLTKTDNTSGLTVTGTIVFTAPSDWATDTVNGVTGKYWVRVSASAISGTPTASLTIPTNNYAVKFYANVNDPMPAFAIDAYGNKFFNYATPKTSFPYYFNQGVYFGATVQCQRLRAARVSENQASTQTISAGGTISFSSSSSRYLQVAGSGGAITLSATSAIQNGSDTGDTITIVGTSETNKVTIPDNANTQNVGDASIELGNKDSVEYRWDGTDWIQNKPLINV